MTDRASQVDALDLDGWEKLCREATPGPWYTAGLPWFQVGSGVLAGSPDPHVGFIIADTEVMEGEREEYAANGGTLKLADPDADARFIAASRTALPKALALARLVDETVKVLEPLAKRGESAMPDPNDPYIHDIYFSTADLYAARTLHAKFIALRGGK